MKRRSLEPTASRAGNLHLCPKHARDWQAVIYGSANFDPSCTPDCPEYQPPYVRKTLKELIAGRLPPNPD